MCANKKSPKRSLFFLAERPRKGLPSNMENFRLDNCSTLAKHHRKDHGPTEPSKNFHLHQDVMRHPNSPNPSNGYASENEFKVESQDFHPSQAVRLPPPTHPIPAVSVKSTWGAIQALFLPRSRQPGRHLWRSSEEPGLSPPLSNYVKHPLRCQQRPNG